MRLAFFKACLIFTALLLPLTEVKQPNMSLPRPLIEIHKHECTFFAKVPISTFKENSIILSKVGPKIDQNKEIKHFFMIQE